MSAASGQRPVEILLVEDNPGDIRLTREALRETTLRTRLNVVSDGAQATSYLRQRPPFEDSTRPDLVLMDLNLPRRNGHEVLKEIKEDTRLRAIPVVILTTSNAEKDIARAYEAHANCYIRKPVDFGQFMDVVRMIERFWFNIVLLPSQQGIL